MKNKLSLLSFSVFLQTQLYMVPFLLLFYQHCGLSVGDFFLFQGVFSLSALFFDVPMGYLADIFPKRNILILSYIFYIFRLILWLFFSQYGYWVLLFAEIMFAAHKASFAGVVDSYMYEYLHLNNIPQKMKDCYGKMNFFLSVGTAFSSLIGAGIYTSISDYTLSTYNYNYGFIALICLELVLQLIATGLLLKLPIIPAVNKTKIRLKELYKKLFLNVVWTLQNRNIKYHILYSGLLDAITLVFVWSFQPIMKLLLLQISLYGVVYFINHLFRALASLYSDKINHIISLSKMALLVFVLFVVCFILTFFILNFSSIPVWCSLGYFTFISITIGIQLAFRLLHTCRLHNFISSDIRATSSSVSTVVGRLYTGFFFILMKICLDGVSLQTSLATCFVIFIMIAFLLRKVCLVSLKDE